MGGELLSSTKLLTALIIILLLAPMLNEGIVTAGGNNDLETFILYFLNGIVVYDSLVNETLILETPINTSLKDGFEQRVVHLLQYNLFFNETIGAHTFKATRGYVGFFLSRVEVHSKPMERMYGSVIQALFSPTFTPTSSSIEMPEEAGSYLRSPHSKVVEVVKPEYERWFKKTYGCDVKDAGPLGIATTAAYFVQYVFINYDPSGVPRSIGEVIDARRGDCDDMSRVLVELLSAYDIPAVTSIGYVYVSDFNITMPIENVTYKYVNCGPHAFAMAYIPGEGWFSLDFLALTFLAHPFVFEGYSRETTVEEKRVQEYLSLHRSLNATQVIVVLREEEMLELMGEPTTLEAVMKYFQGLVKIDGIMPFDALNKTNARYGYGDEKEVEEIKVMMPGVGYVIIVAVTLLLLGLLIILIRRSNSRTTKLLHYLKLKKKSPLYDKQLHTFMCNGTTDSDLSW